MRKPCCDKQGINNKGAWSKQEDQKLIDYITTHGQGCWRSIPQAAGIFTTSGGDQGLHRCGKSCRLRWRNYLRPDIKRGNFAQDEEDLIIKLHALLGNRWSLIAGRLPGRTDNEVKNHWNSHLRKKLINMGIDPNNHRLNQILPRPQPVDDDEEACKSNKSKADNDGVSDAATSSLEEDEAFAGSYHINLELTIAVPSPAHASNLETKPENCGIAATGEVLQNETSPALLLFL